MNTTEIIQTVGGLLAIIIIFCGCLILAVAAFYPINKRQSGVPKMKNPPPPPQMTFKKVEEMTKYKLICEKSLLQARIFEIDVEIKKRDFESGRETEK